MRKLALILSMLLLLSGCSRQTEYVTDEYVNAPCRIVFGVPEGVTQETFSENETASVYEADNGDYRIVSEILPSMTPEEAIETLSGFPAESLNVIRLSRYPMEEYHFAWASAGDEGDSVSRCAVLSDGSFCYALTMTQRAGLGEQYRETADYVFSTFGVTADTIV